MFDGFTDRMRSVLVEDDTFEDGFILSEEEKANMPDGGKNDRMDNTHAFGNMILMKDFPEEPGTEKKAMFRRCFRYVRDEHLMSVLPLAVISNLIVWGAGVMHKPMSARLFVIMLSFLYATYDLIKVEYSLLKYHRIYVKDVAFVGLMYAFCYAVLRFIP